MTRRRALSIQAIQQKFPWIMQPLTWLDVVLTPRRWACGLDRLTTAISRVLVIDSTRPARLLMSLLNHLSPARSWLLVRIPFLVRVDWQLRKFIWSVIWGSVVALRLWPRKPGVPREDKVMRLIPAPATYNDFQSRSLVVPADLPCAELTLMGAMTVQTLHLLQDIYPVITSHQPAASHDPLGRLRGAYSFVYRLVRTPPVWHPDLIGATNQGNLLGALAVGGPFAKLLERSAENPDKYLINLAHLTKYKVRDGLARLGCKIHFLDRGGTLRVSGIECGGQFVTSDDARWQFTQRIALCSLLTHTTVWRHGMQYHVAGVAPFAAITHNLPPAHPVRRLLAVHIAETLSTDFHTHLTLRRSGFDATGFSFPYETILQYYDDGAKDFDISRLDPRLDVARRNIPGELNYPYREQAFAYCDLFESYVRTYVDHYYDTDNDLQTDIPAQIWFDSLDRYITNGIRRYVPDLTKAGLVRLCMLFIYTVTVEHEDNTMWNYAVFLPATVRADGGAQSVGQVQSSMNFQMVISSAANKLMMDTKHLALDAGAAEIMEALRSRLVAMQRQMESEPDPYWRIYPEDLEASVSA